MHNRKVKISCKQRMHCTLSRKGSPPPHPSSPRSVQDRYRSEGSLYWSLSGEGYERKLSAASHCNRHLSTGRVHALEYDLYCTNGNGFAFVKKDKAQTAESVENLQFTYHVNINLILNWFHYCPFKQMPLKKAIAKKTKRILSIFILLWFFAFNFFRNIFESRHQRIWNQHKIMRFLTNIDTKKWRKKWTFSNFFKK
jgi:hypothetical protein